MTRRARVIWLSVVGIATAGLGVAAIAWACTPQAFISVSPSSGPAGSVVTVTGNRFAADGRVELRVGSVDSAPIATATGPTFSVQVTIPQDAKPGQTVIIGALGYDQDGQPAAQPAAGFTIPGPKTAAPAATRPAPKRATVERPASAPKAAPQHR